MKLSVWLATGSWVGLLAPAAPGTFGALLGLPLAWLMGMTPLWVQFLLIVGSLAAAVPICTRATRHLGGSKDPSAIVLDEILSLPITFFAVPFARPELILIGFLLNRTCDISKLPPARQLERLPQGLGIMSDDIAAGLQSCLALHLLLALGL